MKLTAVLAAGAALTLFAAPAFAGDEEVQKMCEDYSAQNGGDASGCSCLADAAEGNQELKDEIVGFTGDFEAASELFQVTVMTCWPQEGASE